MNQFASAFVAQESERPLAPKGVKCPACVHADPGTADRSRPGER